MPQIDSVRLRRQQRQRAKMDSIGVPTGRILSMRANAFSVESLISNAESTDVNADGIVKTALDEGEISYTFIL